MALTQPILSLISDGQGHAKTEFLASSPVDWAASQMQARYSTMRLDDDVEGSFPHLCWKNLCDEYAVLRSWFNESGELQMTLKTASITNKLTGPIGDGVGWDFNVHGQPENQMLFFKSVLIAVYRASQLIPSANRNNGNAQIGNLPKLVYSAYDARAKIHRWRGMEDTEDEIDPFQAVAGRCDITKDKVIEALMAAGITVPDRPVRRRFIDGAEMARRWTALQTYTFLLRIGVSDRKWAWDASRARTTFGPVEEERALL